MRQAVHGPGSESEHVRRPGHRRRGRGWVRWMTAPAGARAVEVPDDELGAVAVQRQVTRLEHTPVVVTEHREEDGAPQPAFGMVPVDVEDAGRRGCRDRTAARHATRVPATGPTPCGSARCRPPGPCRGPALRQPGVAAPAHRPAPGPPASDRPRRSRACCPRHGGQHRRQVQVADAEQVEHVPASRRRRRSSRVSPSRSWMRYVADGTTRGLMCSPLPCGRPAARSWTGPRRPGRAVRTGRGRHRRRPGVEDADVGRPGSSSGGQSSSGWSPWWALNSTRKESSVHRLAVGTRIVDARARRAAPRRPERTRSPSRRPASRSVRSDPGQVADRADRRPVVRPAPRMSRPVNHRRRWNTGCSAPEGDQPRRVNSRGPGASRPGAPVDPGQLVVLAVGVVVARLRPRRSRRRRAASGRPGRGAGWSSRFRIWRPRRSDHRGVVGGPLDAAVPGAVVGLAVSAVLAVGLVVLVVVA